MPPFLAALVPPSLRRRFGQLPALALGDEGPLDLRILGRTLLHAAAVGVAAGLVGSAFVGLLELVHAVLLEGWVGYRTLRAAGDPEWFHVAPGEFRPWLLAVVPAVGGLLTGWVTRYCPEARGGGGDAAIQAFHQADGVLRARVIWFKPLASILTLGSGGAGGREGPTLQIGAAIGSTLARALGLSARERRTLVVAGVAAGVSAVFRTPLGAALLAVEILYRDGFEADALIPSVLSSVVAYAVAVVLLGQTTLLASAGRFPFVAAHLPLFALLALVVAAAAWLFALAMRRTRALFERLPVADWVKPGVGGLLLGLVVTPVIVLVGERVGQPGQGLGLLGGGYGAAQMAVTGAAWFPAGWTGVGLLAALAAAKLVASTLTIGSGGSAGDFAPSLAIGALLGGAFGQAAALLTGDARLVPGAFALVGMGAFYGGVAHVPLAAVVLVCELAGNYDLLVPLMLALGVAYVALRRTSLYEAQVTGVSASPVHRDAAVLDVLRSLRVGDRARAGKVVTFHPETTAQQMVRHLSDATDQEVFPLVGADGVATALVTASALRVLAAEGQGTAFALAADLAEPLVAVTPDDDLRSAAARLLQSRLRALPVLDAQGRVLGLLDESEVARVVLEASLRAERRA